MLDKEGGLDKEGVVRLSLYFNEFLFEIKNEKGKGKKYNFSVY